MLKVHLDGIKTADGHAMAEFTLEASYDFGIGPGGMLPTPTKPILSAGLEEIESVLKVLMAARHQLKVAHQHHAGCVECTLDKLEGGK